MNQREIQFSFCSKTSLSLRKDLFLEVQIPLSKSIAIATSCQCNSQTRKTTKQLDNFLIFNPQMAIYCHYLRLLNIVLFIWSSNSLHYGDFNGLKYIYHDDFSLSKPAFLSSLFDKQGNLDYSKMTKHSRQRRDAKQERVNSTRQASATEYEFHGDNHTVAFLHWSGTRSQVISNLQKKNIFLY